MFWFVRLSVFCFACRFSSGRARPSCLPSSFFLVFLPLFGLPLLFVIVVRVFVPLSIYTYFFLKRPFSPFFPFLFLSCLSFYVSELLACVCCACRTQCDGMALHCLLPLRHYDVGSPCHSFVTTCAHPGQKTIVRMSLNRFLFQLTCLLRPTIPLNRHVLNSFYPRKLRC